MDGDRLDRVHIPHARQPRDGIERRAKGLGMSGYSSLAKDKLVAKLRNH